MQARGPRRAGELPPELSQKDRCRLFRDGVQLFNRGEFFASHERWEEIWRSTTPEPRYLFQGLIQVAAGMHHFLDRGRSGPAKRILARGRARLEGFAATTHGLDLASLLRSVCHWEAWLTTCEGEAPSPPKLEVLDLAQVR